MEPVLYKRLDIKNVFEKLSNKEKLYAYHMSRAAWFGTRIIFRQVSPESSDIFDLIMELHQVCGGVWEELLQQYHLNDGKEQLDVFVQYAALFLSNMGNYYGQGDQKIFPKITTQFAKHLMSMSTKAQNLAACCQDRMLSPKPGNLGFPGPNTQSGYYPSITDTEGAAMTAEDAKHISKLMIEKSIGVENTRIRKVVQENKTVFTILQASVETDVSPQFVGDLASNTSVYLVRGDHSQELRRVSEALEEGIKYCANDAQKQILEALRTFLQTGNLEMYKKAQRMWVKDLGPAVETIFGFLEAYRDPYGSRAEFEGVVAIMDPEGSKALQKLCDTSNTFIAELPWVKNSIGGGVNGPFESDLFDAPEYTAVHALAYSSTMVYLGINLPNFEDIRQTVGLKNIFIANRQQPFGKEDLLAEANSPFLDSTDREPYLLRFQDMENLNIAIHELLGHGTGKLLSEGGADRESNFDSLSPPVNPLTSQVIKTWYKKGETYNGVFGDLATTIEECRAECVSAFLIFEKPLAAIFGYTDRSPVKIDDLIYDLFLHRGVLGLQSLLQYEPKSSKWGQAHARGNFAIFQALLAADGFMKLEVDKDAKKVIVRIDRSKLLTCGRKAIGELLLKIHIYRCTADVDSARKLYGNLTALNSEWLAVRDIVASHQPKREAFVQANVRLEDDSVIIQEYEKSARGLVQSWADRCDLLDL